MTRKWLCTLGILASTGVATAQHRWLAPTDRNLMSDGVWTEFPLPNPASGPTTIALAADGSAWFTEGSGNRIEFEMPRPNSSGTGLTAGSDRQPPRRISNRLGVASSGGNKLLYLTVK